MKEFENTLLGLGFNNEGMWFSLDGFLHPKISISLFFKVTLIGDEESHMVEVNYVDSLVKFNVLYKALTGFDFKIITDENNDD